MKGSFIYRHLSLLDNKAHDIFLFKLWNGSKPGINVHELNCLKCKIVIGVTVLSVTLENGELTTGTRIPDPLFPHLVPPAIMVLIFVWKYIFEPFIHILQHSCYNSLVLLTFVSRSSYRITYTYNERHDFLQQNSAIFFSFSFLSLYFSYIYFYHF